MWRAVRKHQLRTSALLLAGAAVLASVTACGRTGTPRGQLVVFVDTNAPTPEQVAADDALSGAATIDTVRVDVLAADNTSTEIREFSVTTHADWPLSFGVTAPQTGGTSIRLRIRGFRAADATPSLEADAGTTLDPMQGLTIDRVVDVPTPGDGDVDERLVVLDGDCLGHLPSFTKKTACVNGERPEVPFGDPLPPGGVSIASRIGTWARARETPCATAPEAGKRCIPGGISVLGSRDLTGTEDGTITLASIPLRAAWVPAFFLDEREFTVARARPWIAGLKAEKPIVRGEPSLQGSEDCTFTADSSSDDLPLTCVKSATAAELCARVGGSLPTEAEWNHAATGRGLALHYPWGNTDEGCCNTSIGRLATKSTLLKSDCPGVGAESVASHLPKASCHGLGDVSRDGVVDLGGSVSEIVADDARPLDDACWGEPFALLLSPTCSGGSAAAARGANWSENELSLRAEFRRFAAFGPEQGFRCAYPAPAASSK
jgi:formylglycine-generating enzyme required for sulfatase activity